MRAYTDIGEGPWSDAIYRFTDEASKYFLFAWKKPCQIKHVLAQPPLFVQKTVV